jgi:hypothetical protein
VAKIVKSADMIRHIGRRTKSPPFEHLFIPHVDWPQEEGFLIGELAVHRLSTHGSFALAPDKGCQRLTKSFTIALPLLVDYAMTLKLYDL